MEDSASRIPRSRSGPVDIVTGQTRITLYRKAGVVVTHEFFEAAGRRFPVAELSGLRTARGSFDALTMKAMIVTGVSLVGIVAALSLTGKPAGLWPVSYLGLGAAGFFPILLAMVGNRLRPRVFELWGDYHGMTVRLFVCDDEHQYGQVTRALQRAREMAQFGGISQPLASFNPWMAHR